MKFVPQGFLSLPQEEPGDEASIEALVKCWVGKFIFKKAVSSHAMLAS